MNSTAYKNRMDRNLAMLELKKRDIEQKYSDGKVQIDVEGTIKSMSANTILAIPSTLQSRTGKSPSRDIKIKTYDRAGEDAKFLGEKVVHTQGRVMDLDTLLNEKLGTNLKSAESNSTVDLGVSSVVNLPHVDKKEVVQQPVKETVLKPAQDLGRVVKKPRKKKETAIPADSFKEAAEIARRILSK